MPAKFKIQITNPCHEKWGEMQPDTNGKFCGSCQKAVIDFTQFSDGDLQNWFNKNQGESCGRFKPDQLGRLIQGKSSYTINRFKPGLVAASLLAFLSFPKLVNANSAKAPYTQTEGEKAKPFLAAKEVLTDTLRTIKGHVVDQDDKQPVVGAVVSINNRLAYAYTDIKGNFEIQLPENFKGQNCDLTVSYVGYKTLNSKVALTDNDQLRLELCISGQILGGVEVVIVRHSLWRRILYQAKNQLNDINPFYKKMN